MNQLFKNPKTTIGGAICLMAAVGLLAHWLDRDGCLALMGVGAGIAGFAAKDANAK